MEGRLAPQTTLLPELISFFSSQDQTNLFSFFGQHLLFSEEQTHSTVVGTALAACVPTHHHQHVLTLYLWVFLFSLSLPMPPTLTIGKGFALPLRTFHSSPVSGTNLSCILHSTALIFEFSSLLLPTLSRTRSTNQSCLWQGKDLMM